MVERRIGQHNKGENRSTKAYKPFKLIYTEAFNTRIEAREREKYLKSGIGKGFLKSLNECGDGEIGRRTTLRW